MEKCRIKVNGILHGSCLHRSENAPIIVLAFKSNEISCLLIKYYELNFKSFFVVKIITFITILIDILKLQ